MLPAPEAHGDVGVYGVVGQVQKAGLRPCVKRLSQSLPEKKIKGGKKKNRMIKLCVKPYSSKIFRIFPTFF